MCWTLVARDREVDILDQVHDYDVSLAHVRWMRCKLPLKSFLYSALSCRVKLTSVDGDGQFPGPEVADIEERYEQW